MKFYLSLMIILGSITYYYAGKAVEHRTAAVERYTNAIDAAVDAAVRGSK